MNGYYEVTFEEYEDAVNLGVKFPSYVDAAIALAEYVTDYAQRHNGKVHGCNYPRIRYTSTEGVELVVAGPKV